MAYHARHVDSLAVAGMRKSRRKNRIVVGMIILAAVAVACLVGFFSYFHFADKNLGLVSSDINEVLTPAKEGEPYYVLCSADLSVPDKMAPSIDDYVFMLVRVDEQNHKITFVNIPSSLSVKFNDGAEHELGSQLRAGNEKSLVSAVGALAGVSISHYVTTDSEKLTDMVDALGGVEMNLSCEVDDPNAGSVVIDAGEQMIDGREAVVLLRAYNVAGGFAGTAENRIRFTCAVLNKVLDLSTIEYTNVVSDAGNYISTDWQTSSLLSSGNALKPPDSIEIYDCTVPYMSSTNVNDGQRKDVCDTAEWEVIARAVRDGNDPAKAMSYDISNVARDFTVEIRNGASIDGAAASLKDKLASVGYVIGDVGNTSDNTVYPDTLVIYTDSENKNKAKRILSDIGQGRLVNGGDFYVTDSDVLVIIGSDWVS